jgi:hypothetical protein
MDFGVRLVADSAAFVAAFVDYQPARNNKCDYEE